jgi:hypothetical protein
MTGKAEPTNATAPPATELIAIALNRKLSGRFELSTRRKNEGLRWRIEGKTEISGQLGKYALTRTRSLRWRSK